MKRIVALTITLLLMVGCGSIMSTPFNAHDNASVSKETTNTIDGNSLAGMQLNILGSYHEDMVRRLAEMFRDETGCNVSYIRLPTGEGVARLVVEKDNPAFNVYIGGTVDAHENLKHQGILAAYSSSVESEIQTKYIDPDGVWKAQYIEILSIGVNTERWEKEFAGLEPPSTLQDLLNPAFKGEIIIPDPSTSGTGYTFLSSLLQLMDEEKGWEFIEAINGQVGQYTASGYTAAEKTGLGEYLICVNFLSDQLIVSNSGYPLKSTVYEGAGWSMCPVSIVTGSEKNVAAQKFIDFCISKRALDALVELGNCVAVRDDCIRAHGNINLSDMNYNRKYNPIEAAGEKDGILERFGALVG